MPSSTRRHYPLRLAAIIGWPVLLNHAGSCPTWHVQSGEISHLLVGRRIIRPSELEWVLTTGAVVLAAIILLLFAVLRVTRLSKRSPTAFGWLSPRSSAPPMTSSRDHKDRNDRVLG
jgi:hypothetical protein